MDSSRNDHTYKLSSQDGGFIYSGQLAETSERAIVASGGFFATTQTGNTFQKNLGEQNSCSSTPTKQSIHFSGPRPLQKSRQITPPWKIEMDDDLDDLFDFNPPSASTQISPEFNPLSASTQISGERVNLRKRKRTSENEHEKGSKVNISRLSTKMSTYNKEDSLITKSASPQTGYTRSPSTSPLLFDSEKYEEMNTIVETKDIDTASKTLRNRNTSDTLRIEEGKVIQ